MAPAAWRSGVQVSAAFGAAAVFSALWSLHAGKDLNWDLLHYHYYAAYAFLENRLERDFFAASAQGYLNPVGFLPFYWMVSSGWHSAIVSIVLASAHAANFALLFAISRMLFAHHAPRERLILALLAAALGTASAVFWATVGTSFLDPLLTVPMLAGILLLMPEHGQRAAMRTASAGVLFGAAAALKYSNAIFALAGIVLAASVPAVKVVARVRAAVTYSIGTAAGVVLFGGATLLHMYREYGNPVFPLFNAWFRSSDFPPITIFAERFAPKSLADALAFPLRVVSPESMIYAEISAPDLRFLALGVLAVAIAVAVLLPGPAQGTGRSLRSIDARLLGFFALA